MTLPLPLLAALLLLALLGVLFVLLARRAPIIHDAVTVEPVREDTGEYDNE